jgi:hypothetical protein
MRKERWMRCCSSTNKSGEITWLGRGFCVPVLGCQRSGIMSTTAQMCSPLVAAATTLAVAPMPAS